jgi:membrane protein implicated in regulation of membrane protease activity
MENFLQGMPALLQAFWWVAIISSLIFLVQTILTIIGSNHVDGMNADFNGEVHDGSTPFHLFSFRNFINFLLGFGWGGIAFYNNFSQKGIVILLALIVGAVFVGLFFLIIKQIMKFSEDNTFDINKLKDKRGDVYLLIPAAMSGKGKVQISLKGSTHEIDAMTEGEAISSGSPVKVVSIKDNILIVTKI